MKLKKIRLSGYKNIYETTMELSKIAAIISPNNYGKSNLLDGINFATQFMSETSANRKKMMEWVRGIPLVPKLQNENFIFEIEFENKSDDLRSEYRFIRYGFEFAWYKDNESGQKIINEWLDVRANESVRYTALLKRDAQKYRKSKASKGFRNLPIESNVLYLDILSLLEDIEFSAVLKKLQTFSYQICSSLDLSDRFQSTPIEYGSETSDTLISFDENDVPNSLYRLRQLDPYKYDLFLEAIYTLFPEFTNIEIETFHSQNNVAQMNQLIQEKTDGAIPFRIKNEFHQIFISSSYLNQPLNMTMMSTGTKRIFWLLTNIFIASHNGCSLIGVEELETSIHPRMICNLLETLDELLEDTALIVSSHSPFLVQYVDPCAIYVGTNSEYGFASFSKVKKSKLTALLSAARGCAMSIGEYLFELMSGDLDSYKILKGYLEEKDNG